MSKLLVCGIGALSCFTGLLTVRAGKDEAKPLPSMVARLWAVTFTPDGRYVVCAEGGQAPSIRFWDVESGKEVKKLPFIASGSIYAIAVSRDGERIAVGGADQQARIFTKDGKKIASLEHPAAVSRLIFSRESDTLFSACNRDEVIRQWDASTGKLIKELKGHLPGNPGRGIQSLDLSPDGTELASAGADGKVRIWDVKNGQERRQFDGVGGGVKYSPDGKYLSANQSALGKVKIYDANTGEEAGGINVKTHGMLGFSSDGKAIYIDDLNSQSVRKFGVPGCAEIEAYNTNLAGRLFNLTVSPRGDAIAWCGEADKNGPLRLLRLPSP